MSNTTKTKAPTHRIYSVSKDANDKARWVQLGVAFTHKDGLGLDLLYNACPIGDAKVVLRKITPKQATAGGAQ